MIELAPDEADLIAGRAEVQLAISRPEASLAGFRMAIGTSTQGSGVFPIYHGLSDIWLMGWIRTVCGHGHAT
jgi:hypothetical protein